MREWISLIEDYTIPSFRDAVTDELINHMIETGKYVDHGGDLEDQWDGGVFDYPVQEMHPELEGKTFEEVRYTPEFKEVLKALLLRVADEHQADLGSGSKYHGTESLSPNTKIYRGISGALNSDMTTGVYWSLLQSQALGRFIDENRGGVLLVAELKDVTVDWDETIRSRLDLAHGQDEQEIQLKKGTPVKTRAFNVSFKSGRPVVTNGIYLYRKA